MKTLHLTAACLMLACTPAFACQPPSNMPTDPAAAAKFWEEGRANIENDLFSNAPTVLVARIASAKEGHPSQDRGKLVIAARLVPIKILRAAGPLPQRGEIAFHWCDDYKPHVEAGQVYLLAMSGTKIDATVALDEGKERQGVAAFFARSGQPNPWK